MSAIIFPEEPMAGGTPLDKLVRADDVNRVWRWDATKRCWRMVAADAATFTATLPVVINNDSTPTGGVINHDFDMNGIASV